VADNKPGHHLLFACGLLGYRCRPSKDGSIRRALSAAGRRAVAAWRAPPPERLAVPPIKTAKPQSLSPPARDFIDKDWRRWLLKSTGPLRQFIKG